MQATKPQGGAASHRPFRKTGQGVPVNGEVNPGRGKPKRKQQARSPSGPGAWCARQESLAGYPKPVDLRLGRLKPPEREVEDRRAADVQIAPVTWV